MDFSKAYDCFPHDFLIAKLEAYGPDKFSLYLVNDYLRFRRQKKKIGSLYNDWANVTRGIPQRSILGPHIVFLWRCLSVVLKSLEHDVKIFFKMV